MAAEFVGDIGVSEIRDWRNVGHPRSLYRARGYGGDEDGFYGVFDLLV